MFPLLFIAAVMMAAAGAGKKRKKVRRPANFAAIHTKAEYDRLVKAKAFSGPTVAVIPLKDEAEVTSLMQQASRQMGGVFFLVAAGSEARALITEWAKPEDYAFIYAFPVEALSEQPDPLGAIEHTATQDRWVYVVQSVEGFMAELSDAVGDALGQPPAVAPEPEVEVEVEEKPDIQNPWAPFPNLGEMQEALMVLGFSVGTHGADNDWGSGTQSGVRDFQNHVNSVYGMDLRKDGEPDEPTRVAINVALDLFSAGDWQPPGGAPPQQPEQPEPEPHPEPQPDPSLDEPQPPAPGEQWQPADMDEISWSDKLFVAPDCSRVVKGNFWASQRLNPRIIAAAKEGGNVFAEDLLDAEIAKDSPFCLDVGYAEWGDEMQGWYDTWADLIYEDLEIYAANPELLGEAP